MLIKYLTSILIINFLITDLYPQTIQESEKYAENQFNSGNYFNAITAYRRILFFEPDQQNSEIFQNLSLCYFKLNDYKKSHYYNQLAYSMEKNDSIKTEIGLKNVFMYILQKEYNYALSDILALPIPTSKYLLKKYNFYKGVIFFLQHKFIESQQYFSLSLKHEDKRVQKKLDSLFLENKKISRKKPVLARYMCVFIPGSGQFYAGYPIDALNSIAISGAFLYLYFYTIKTYSFIDGILAVLPWFERYYFGGMDNAEELTIKKINNKRNVIYKQILEIYY